MKVLLFDYDGTIVDTLDDVCRGFNKVAAEFNLRKRSKREVALLYKRNIFDSFLKIGVKKKDLGKFNDAMRDIYPKKVKLFKGIKSSIDKLEKENRVFIVTSNDESAIISSVRQNKIKSHGILGAEKGFSKVKKIKAIKKKYPKSEIIYIGDTLGDMIEAKKAGVKSIGVSWGFNSRGILKKGKPDYIVDRPEDLVKVLK